MQLQVAQMIHIQNDLLVVIYLVTYQLQMINSSSTSLAQMATWYAYFCVLPITLLEAIICNSPS